VHLLGTAGKVSGDAAINLTILQRMGKEVNELHDERDVRGIASKAGRAALVIDALLGTGLKGELTGLYAALISAIADYDWEKLSVLEIPNAVREKYPELQAEVEAILGM